MNNPASSSNSDFPLVSVIIPTFLRPDGLKAAVESVLAQKATEAAPVPPFEIIVVDNDPKGSAAETIAQLQTQAQGQAVTLIACHESRPGVAYARNCAIAAANGEFIAFLDDDEVAFPDWLSRHAAGFRALGCDVSFGPIQGRVPEGTPAPKDYFEGFFSRLVDGPTREYDDTWGCGNSFMRVASVFPKDNPTPFDPKSNETGGEDDLLFHALKARGGRFGWIADAWVYEDAPTKRANWAYLRKRSFAYGHNTTAQHFESDTPHWPNGIASMAKGLAQGLGMWLVFVGLRLTNHPKWAFAYDKMWRGWGKLLWFGPFKQNFYGQAALEKAKP